MEFKWYERHLRLPGRGGQDVLEVAYYYRIAVCYNEMSEQGTHGMTFQWKAIVSENWDYFFGIAETNFWLSSFA